MLNKFTKLQLIFESFFSKNNSVSWLNGRSGDFDWLKLEEEWFPIREVYISTGLVNEFNEIGIFWGTFEDGSSEDDPEVMYFDKHGRRIRFEVRRFDMDISVYDDTSAAGSSVAST